MGNLQAFCKVRVCTSSEKPTFAETSTHPGHVPARSGVGLSPAAALATAAAPNRSGGWRRVDGVSCYESFVLNSLVLCIALKKKSLYPATIGLLSGKH